MSTLPTSYGIGKIGGRGLPGDRYKDPRQRLSELLLQAGVQTGPIAHPMQGLARLAQAAAGAYLQHKVGEDRNAANEALVRGVSAQPWVNPDTGEVAPDQNPTGGYAGALHALGGLQGNPYAGRLSREMAMQQFARQQAIGDRDEERRYQAGLAQAKREDEERKRLAEIEDAKNLAIWKQQNLRQEFKPGTTYRTGDGPPTTIPALPEYGKDTPYPPAVQAQRVEAARATAPPAPQIPTSAVKMQDEHLAALSTAQNIETDMQGLQKQIADGSIDLGLFTNWWSQGRNAAGMSTEQSRNFGSFMSSLQKLRNDSLRLNSGVQTEGDAQRAWDELFASINDKALVQQRLQEIALINRRAALQRKFQIDTLRRNWGADPFDFTQLPAAAVVGQGQPAPAAPAGAPGASPAAGPPQTPGMAPDSPAATAAPPVTATGPNGEKLILQNGQWVPMR